MRINQPLRKPKSVEGVPPFLSDGTPIFLYYYQSARTNRNFMVFIVPAPVNQYRLLYQPLEFCLHLLE
jgi:hypothetical protein